MGVRSLRPSTLMTAMSETGSAPTRVAEALVPSENATRSCAPCAPATVVVGQDQTVGGQDDTGALTALSLRGGYLDLHDARHDLRGNGLNRAGGSVGRVGRSGLRSVQRVGDRRGSTVAVRDDGADHATDTTTDQDQGESAGNQRHASRLRLCGGRTGVRPLQRCGDLVVAAARAVRTAGATRVGCAVRGALLVRGLMGTVRVAESLRGLLLLRLPEGFGGPAFSGSGFGGSGERFGRLVRLLRRLPLRLLRRHGRLCLRCRRLCLRCCRLRLGGGLAVGLLGPGRPDVTVLGHRLAFVYGDHRTGSHNCSADNAALRC